MYIGVGTPSKCPKYKKPTLYLVYIYIHVDFLIFEVSAMHLLLHIRRDVIRWPAATGTSQHNNHHTYGHDHNLAGAHDRLSNGHAFFCIPLTCPCS